MDINENRTFVSPLPTDISKRDEQDEEIFLRTRLVSCGYFIYIILGGMACLFGARRLLIITLSDYVGAILVRDRSDWRPGLDPLMASLYLVI